MRAVAAANDDSAMHDPLARLLEAAEALIPAWSGSNIGFHADVYYADLQAPPPGAHFSPEWGFQGMFQGTTGNWREYQHGELVALIEARAGQPDLTEIRKRSAEARDLVTDTHDDVLSILRSVKGPDAHLTDLIDIVAGLVVPTSDDYIAAILPTTMWSRDTTALSQGRRPAPHQEIVARVVHLRAPFDTAAQLAKLCSRAARHLARTQPHTGTAANPAGRACRTGCS